MADFKPESIAEAQRRAQEIAAKLTASALGGGVPPPNDDTSRKRPLEDYGADGPDMKKPSVDGVVAGVNPQAIAQAAISKISGQIGLTQMITIEIKVPNRMVGLVIGRGGEMINKLQSESGARIQVAPDGTEVSGERQVSIYGTPDTVEKAKMLVNKVVEDSGGAATLPMGMNILQQISLEPGQEVVELMIPANKVGLIIGKGGEMIKMLQERAGCKMQMIQDGPFASAPDKPLRMTGFPENCKKARQLVLELIEQKEMENAAPSDWKARGYTGDLSRGMPDTIELQVPKSLVGFVIGRGGEHIMNIQNTCGVRLQFQNDVPGTTMRLATISGPPDACHRAKHMVEEIIAERQQQGVKPRLELPNPAGPNVASSNVPVPANKCGLVIGKGGDTIRQLMVQSGAHIELFRGPQPNEHEKLFTVRGSTQQIQLATQLIRQKVDAMVGPGGPGGFQGQPPGMPFQGPGGPMGYAQPGGFPGHGPMPGGPSANPWAQYGYGGGFGPYGNPAVQQPPQHQQPQQPHQAAAAAQAQSTAADAAQAWAAYYQQYYAQAAAANQAGANPQAQPQQHPPPQAQPQPQQPPAPGSVPAGQPPPQAAQAPAPGAQPDLQAQWAEYYRQLGYYYGQQGQPQPGAPGTGGEQK